jgi:Protein of unknown function with PCYCGC motif
MKTALILMVLLCVAAITQAQFASQPTGVPAFHDKPPAKGEVLPPVLTESQLAQQGLTLPAQIASYKAVAKMPAAMYQQPCYCYCDRNHGHKSLHSCFESTHGAACGICMGEALYTYQMSKKGWSPSQIRDGIIRGDWKLIDLQHPEPVN